MSRILEYNGRKPELGRGVFLAPGSVVVGDVKIGDYSTIWYNAVVRGDVENQGEIPCFYRGLCHGGA